MKAVKRSTPASKLTARDLMSLLRIRHADDLFVPECKDGPTWGGGSSRKHLRVDAWAMKRSWSRPCLSGYEVKVSRSDFVNDEKAHLYLAMCNRFYFVCPPKLISPDEVPDGAGLLWSSSNGTRLYTKKKAPHRDIDPPVDLLTYVLMCRVRKVDNERRYGEDNDRESRVEVLRKFTVGKAELQDLGHGVGVRIRELDRELHHREVTVELREQRVDEARAVLKEHGINLTSWAVRESIAKAVERESAGCVTGLVRDLTAVRSRIEATEKKLAGVVEKYKNEKGGNDEGP